MIISHKLLLDGHRTFSFWPTVWSHGWCELLPFSVNLKDKTLKRILELPDGTLAELVMKGKRNKVEVNLQAEGELPMKDLEYVENKVKYILSMDVDLSPLYQLVRKETGFSWIAIKKAGRLLRSPTVFEDIVKTICTTNCTWKQTRNMVQRLCSLLGKKFKKNQYSFPQPNVIANSSIDVLRLAGLGYRSRYIFDLALRISRGELNVEEWAHSSSPTEELRKTIEGIPGIGSYASTNILRLLGRTDHFFVENWMIRTFSEKRNAGKPATISDIAEYYSRFGKWKGLIFWLDMIHMMGMESIK